VYCGIEPQLVAQVHAALQTLSPQEEFILRMRFGIGGCVHCVDQVGQRFGMTQARVRQIETHALQKLRAAAVRRELGSTHRYRNGGATAH